MTWWAWILEIGGLCLLALAILYGIRNTVRMTPMKPFSLVVSAIAALVAAVSFSLLSPGKPPAWLLALLGVAGLIAGALIVLPARALLKDGELQPSQGYWYLVTWSSALFVSSILVVSGPAASRVASCITVLFSAGVLSYSTVLYARYRVDTSRESVTVTDPRPADRTPPFFCPGCGAPVPGAEKPKRFCTRCGAELV